MASGVANLRRSMLVYISQSTGAQALFLILDHSPLNLNHMTVLYFDDLIRNRELPFEKVT